jgi:5-formyltetrahydrofolate cyclo-ligase
MTKAELRKKFLEQRLALSEPEFQKLNIRLSQMFFFSVNLTDVKIIHVYLPIEKFREPDTWLIINHLNESHPSIQVVVPKVSHSTQTITTHSLNKNKLAKNKWGISEPTADDVVNAGEIDLVLVPLLAFDNTGARVGYGKGFYDKFLAQCRADCRRVGLSLFPPVDKIEPVEWFDKPLDVVITPDAVYHFPSRHG